MNESVEQLEQKLKIAKQIKDVNDFFDNSKCPICGTQSIRPKIFVKTDEAMSYGFASVKCTKCGLFNYERGINGYDAYHWNYNGSSELSMLEELKMKTMKYLK